MSIDPYQSALYILSILLVVSGISMIVLAIRGKIIPFIGFRIGYVYVSPRIWRKYNLLSGIIIAVLGVAIHPLSWFIGVLNSILIAPVALIVVFFYLTLRTEHEAEKILIKESSKAASLPEIRLARGFPLAIPVMLTSILLTTYTLALIILSYPGLQDEIAVHFTSSGIPDSYLDKQAGITMLVFSQLLVFTITLYMCYLGIKKPESFYKPYIRWEYARKTVNIKLAVILAVNVVVSLTTIDTVYYNLTGKRIALAPYSCIVLYILLAVLIPLTIYYMVRGYFTSKNN